MEKSLVRALVLAIALCLLTCSPAFALAQSKAEPSAMPDAASGDSTDDSGASEGDAPLAPAKPEPNPANPPAKQPGNQPANTPGSTPGSTPGNTPGNTPANQPANTPGNQPTNAPEPTVQPAQQLVLTECLFVTVNRSTLVPGQETQAFSEVTPKGAQAQVAWSSSNPDLLTVDRSGAVRVPADARPDAGGEYVDVWARATDGSFAMHCATVRVMPAVRSVTVLPANLTVRSDDPAMLATASAELSPESLFGLIPIEWSSSNPEIVTVRASGATGELALITWSGTPGQATITARTAGNSDCSDHIMVTVLPSVPHS
ncbi:MAG: Ig-like domain-containing protein [Clostridia bacterium]